MYNLKMLVLLILSLLLVMACGSGKKANDTAIKSPETLLEEGDALMQAGDYNKAVQTYESILVLHPTSDYHVDTQLRMAEAYGKMERFEDQMDLLLRILKENIIPGYVPEIYVQLGKFYERAAGFNPGIVDTDTSDFRKAIHYYERATGYEDSDDIAAKAEALFRHGLVEAKLGNVDQATLFYETVAYQYPNVTHATLAKIKLQDPNDTTELPTDENSMQDYYDRLGIEPAQNQVDKPEEEMQESEELFPESEK